MTKTFDFERANDFDNGQTYTEKCRCCGKEIKVSTQEDNCPEYYTDVFVKCDCGNPVHFCLPVN